MATPATPLHTLTCPTCGAPLEVKENKPTIRCQYCNASVENPHYHRPAPVQPRMVAQPAPRPSGLGRLIGLFTLGMVVICVAGGGILIYGLVSGAQSVAKLANPFPDVSLLPIQIETAALMLNTDGAPSLVAGTYNIASNAYSLSRLDLGAHKVLWNALSQKDYLRYDASVPGDTLLYLAIDTRLVAVQLSDGRQAWEATLPDQLPGACPTCLVYQNGQVLALTADDSLGAYDAQTGHQTWEKQLKSPRHDLHTVGSGVAVTYEAKKGALGIFDAATGQEQVHIEPTCKAPDSLADDIGSGVRLVFDTASQPARVYTFYGLFNSCVQSWDLSTGKMDWALVESDQRQNATDAPILLVDGTLYYATEHGLRSLDAATGTQVQTLEQNDQYALVPLVVDGSRLIVRARRTNGTTRFELWGYDLQSGKNLWKRPLLKSEPIDPPGEMAGLIDKDTSGWTYLKNDAGLWLITFQTEPNQVNIAQVNLDTGELSNQKSISLGLDNSGTTDYDIPQRAVGPSKLAGFTLANGLYFIDPTSDKFAFRWP